MHLLPLALLLAGTAAYYDTVLEKKCMALRRSNENSAYINGYCFVSMREKMKITHDTWPELQRECNLVNGYKGQLAIIPDKPLIAKLFTTGVTALGAKYFVGARQHPIPNCTSNGGTCKDEKQRQNWYFFDEKNEKIATVNKNVWLDTEPGNQSPTESVAVLESFDSYKGGLNDVNPALEPYQTLCQFTDYLKCDDGYILIRDKCYKINKEPKNAGESKRSCESEGAVLASIHDDAMNSILLDYARDIVKDVENPVRFGLSYGSSWSNDDGTTVDYFRWWDQAGCGIPTPFSSGNVRAALVVSGMARNPDPSYWIVIKDKDAYPFLCQKNPGKAYDV